MAKAHGSTGFTGKGGRVAITCSSLSRLIWHWTQDESVITVELLEIAETPVLVVASPDNIGLLDNNGVGGSRDAGPAGGWP
jgi:hypothetical protein